MADFTKAYKLTMGHEGGYANNPLDTGGETYKGVARNFNPDWQGWAAVDAVKKTTNNVDRLNQILANNNGLQILVNRFYKAEYWDAIRLDSVQSQPLAEKLFDISVNMGVERAARLWQEALDLSNGNGLTGQKISIDGIVGPQTLSLTNQHARPGLLFKVIAALQAERYLNIMRNNPTQKVFASSWFNRV